MQKGIYYEYYITCCILVLQLVCFNRFICWWTVKSRRMPFTICPYKEVRRTNPQTCSQLPALRSSDSSLHHISSSHYWVWKLNVNQFLLLHSSDKCWGMKTETVPDRNTWSDSDFLLSSRCVARRNFSCSLFHTRTEEKLQSDTRRV